MTDADWNEHKNWCRPVEDIDETMPQDQSVKSPEDHDVTKLGFWENLTPQEAYIQLIDAYRLREDDDYIFSADAHGYVLIFEENMSLIRLLRC